jgi:hypothetical protein
VAAAVPGGAGGDINEVATNGGAAGFATALVVLGAPSGHYTIPGQSIDGMVVCLLPYGTKWRVSDINFYAAGAHFDVSRDR